MAARRRKVHQYPVGKTNFSDLSGFLPVILLRFRDIIVFVFVSDCLHQINKLCITLQKIFYGKEKLLKNQILFWKRAQSIKPEIFQNCWLREFVKYQLKLKTRKYFHIFFQLFSPEVNIDVYNFLYYKYFIVRRGHLPGVVPGTDSRKTFEYFYLQFLHSKARQLANFPRAWNRSFLRLLHFVHRNYYHTWDTWLDLNHFWFFFLSILLRSNNVHPQPEAWGDLIVLLLSENPTTHNRCFLKCNDRPTTRLTSRSYSSIIVSVLSAWLHYIVRKTGQIKSPLSLSLGGGPITVTGY